MKIIAVYPGEEPRVEEINKSLESLQGFVGGYIEAIYPFEDEVAVVCNEEGKIINLPANRPLKDENGNVYDIIHGPFFICGLGKQNFTNIPEKFINKYMELFKEPIPLEDDEPRMGM